MLLKSRNSPTLSFYIDWFTRNYKDQTESKLPKSDLDTYILKTGFHQGRHGKGCNCWVVCIEGKIKTWISTGHQIRGGKGYFSIDFLEFSIENEIEG